MAASGYGSKQPGSQLSGVGYGRGGAGTLPAPLRRFGGVMTLKLFCATMAKLTGGEFKYRTWAACFDALYARIGKT